jgi:hypothetical protein
MKKIMIFTSKIIFIFLLIFVLVFGAMKVLEPKYPVPMYWVEYNVKPGDTLWEIVPRKFGYRINDIINLVKEHNHISYLIAYETIELPVW